LAAQLGINVVGRLPGTLRSHAADLVWLSRGYIPGLNDLVRLTGRPRLLDVDDAVWLSEPFGPGAAARLARHVDAVIAGNTFLADWYAPHCRCVEIVPTGVDCATYRPQASGGPTDVFRIGWIGTSGNLPFLRAIFTTISRFLRDRGDARFLVISDRAPAWWAAEDPQLEFQLWRADQEVAMLNRIDVGLMPLPDTDWARGKCAYKMLQYMAVGCPVIVSPVGMNREVLGLGACGMAASSADEWYAALEYLYADEGGRRRMGLTGRGIVTESFDLEVIVRRYASVFRTIIGG
jgi:glycosyltransferase involved in cell wall biosynthesis